MTGDGVAGAPAGSAEPPAATSPAEGRLPACMVG